MDVSALKSPEPDALPAKGKKTKGIASTVVTITNLAQSFTEMVKAGFSIDRGAGAITDRFSFTDSNPADRPPSPRRRNDAPNDTSGHYDYRRDNSGRDYLRADGYRNDSGERAKSGGGNINAAGRGNSASGPATVSPRDDAAGKSSNRSASNSANSANSANSSGKNDNGPKQASGESGDASTKNAAGAAGIKTAGSNSAAVKSNAEKILTSQIASAFGSSRPSRISEQAGAKTLDTGGSENAAKGLAKALATTSKHSRSNTGDQAGLKNHGENGQANAKAKATADVQSAIQAATDPVAKTRDVKARQAAGIAKAAGDDNLAVQVAVQNEADVLVSKPRSSLLGATAKTTGNNKSTTGHNDAHSPAKSGLVQAQNQVAAQAQSGLQQASQARTTSGLSIKAQAQGAFANTGVQTAGGTGGTGGTGGIGGENLPGAGAGATGQTDHGGPAGEAKATARQASLPSRAVINQVTVQITKALSAGVDKINIQLRPETLGRVEVQLEMAKDGKAAAVVIADNKDTLNMLKQDSQNLQQALQDAGLDLNSGDLSFNLRGEEAGGKESNGGQGVHGMAESGGKSGEKVVEDTPYAGIYNNIIEEDRIDVHA